MAGGAGGSAQLVPKAVPEISQVLVLPSAATSKMTLMTLFASRHTNCPTVRSMAGPLVRPAP